MPTIKEKPLKTPNQSNPQIREYIDAIEQGKNALHIFPGANGWQLKKIGGTDFGVFDTQGKAVSRAQEVVKTSATAISAIITHDENGLISDRIDSPSVISAPDIDNGFFSLFGKWFR